MKSKKLQAQPVATALAVWSALLMLVLWLLSRMGFYVSAAEQMARWHVFFNPSLVGLIGGMIEAAVMSVIGVYLFVYIYNLFAAK